MEGQAAGGMTIPYSREAFLAGREAPRKGEKSGVSRSERACVVDASLRSPIGTGQHRRSPVSRCSVAITHLKGLSRSGDRFEGLIDVKRHGDRYELSEHATGLFEDFRATYWVSAFMPVVILSHVAWGQRGALADALLGRQARSQKTGSPVPARNWSLDGTATTRL